MGAKAYTHILTAVASTDRSFMHISNIPQTYKTIMGTVNATSMIGSGTGMDSFNLIVNPQYPSSSSYDNSRGWSKGFYIAGTSSKWNNPNVYDSWDSTIGKIGASSYFTYFDDQVNTVVFYCYDYADVNTVTSVAYQGGSPYFGDAVAASGRPLVSIGCSGEKDVGAMTSMNVGPGGFMMSGTVTTLYGIN